MLVRGSCLIPSGDRAWAKKGIPTAGVLKPQLRPAIVCRSNGKVFNFPQLASDTPVGAASTSTLTLTQTEQGVPEPAPEAGAEPISWTARWWPVMSLHSLDPKTPQHVDLLGLSLVVWCDSAGSWHCLEDRCPHRLAPLSQGRVEGDSLMCSYHGWTFSASGSCVNIPQLNHDPKAQAVACTSQRSCAKAYPTSTAHGLLWVWPEAGEGAAAAAAQVPAGDMIESTENIPPEKRRPWYVREVPMRYDSLMENFLDPTHVPFSHHGLMGTDRKKPRISDVWATTTLSPVTPEGCVATAANGSQVEFVAPLLTKYRYMPGAFGPRLLAVPTKPGWSKLYWNELLPLRPLFPGPLSFLNSLKVVRAIGITLEHLVFRNVLIDGDAYLIHLGERQLPVSGGVGMNTVSRLFYMPASGDSAVIGLRKWLQTFGGDVPTCSPGDQLLMPPAMPQTQVIDRYSQHTKDCPECKQTLAILDRIRPISIAVGALAAMAAVACAVAAAVLPQLQLLPPAAPTVGLLLAATALFAAVTALSGRFYGSLGTWRQKFFFEEYIHAHRD